MVVVNASKEGRSRQRFSYVVRRGGDPFAACTHVSPKVPDCAFSSQLPLVHYLEPTMGPKAGGTRITIHGSHLQVGSELQVLLNDTEPCTELV